MRVSEWFSNHYEKGEIDMLETLNGIIMIPFAILMYYAIKMEVMR